MNVRHFQSFTPTALGAILLIWSALLSLVGSGLALFISRRIARASR
jgi:hypothetical protein